jgi:hypothetical protein
VVPSLKEIDILSRPMRCLASSRPVLVVKPLREEEALEVYLLLVAKTYIEQKRLISRSIELLLH